MSIFCFREALAYLGLQLRPTFQKEIDKQEVEIKKRKKKLKEKLRKLSWSVAAVTRKRGAENYFIWGLSGEELSKLNISSQSKAQCWFRKQKTELKIIEKTKICIPAMLKPHRASSFCLPNKNRVGVAHGDGTNLEVVYTCQINTWHFFPINLQLYIYPYITCFPRVLQWYCKVTNFRTVLNFVLSYFWKKCEI